MDISELSIAERVALLASNYSAEASVYERTWAGGLREIGDRVLERMDLSSAELVVDIGAGVGAVLPDMAKLAPKAFVVGVDRSAGMIARAAPEHGRAVMDAAHLAFGSELFDAATLFFVLFHIPDPLDGLSGASRILRSGGRVGTATWGTEETWPAFESWSDELDAHGASPHQSVMSQHELVDSTEKIEALMQRARFKGIRVSTETLRREYQPHEMIEFATGMAIAKRRFDSLAPEVRERFLQTAKARIARLEPEDFILTSEVIVATATKP